MAAIEMDWRIIQISVFQERKIMGRRLVFFFAAVLVVLSCFGFSIVEHEVKSGFEVSWYYLQDETNPYNTKWHLYQYFGDYNGDAIPDFLIPLKNPETGDVRIFTLDTSATGQEKTYDADRTGGRDFEADPDTFVPHRMDYVLADSGDKLADLWIIGTDAASADSPSTNFTKFIFCKLDKSNQEFPTIATYSIAVNWQLSPNLLWLSTSFNEDTYPDVLVYNAKHDEQGMFIVSLYSGADGSLIRTRSFEKDEDEPAEPSMGMPPIMTVYPLSGDFDDNGFPDFLLFYTFTKGSMMAMDYASCNNIALINNNGDYISPYSGWERVAEIPMSLMGYLLSSLIDLNKDDHVDVVFTQAMVMSVNPPPLFFGYDLKNKERLFSADNSDFGGSSSDLGSYFLTPAYDSAHQIHDVSGDSWCDLVAIRSYAFGSEAPTMGLLNAYAGNGDEKGRKIWLESFSGYTSIQYPVGNFNQDAHADFSLVQNPDAPETEEAGNITWNIGEYMMQSDAPSAGRSFPYNFPCDFAHDPENDNFYAAMGSFNGWLDMGGSADNDYMCIFNYSWDQGNDSTIERTGSAIHVYDGDQSQDPPQTLAEMFIRATDVTESLNSMFIFSTLPGKIDAFVDNNGDGKYNDAIIENELAVFAVSHPGEYSGSKATKDKILRIILGKGDYTQEDFDVCDVNKDGKIDITDLILFLIQNP